MKTILRVFALFTWLITIISAWCNHISPMQSGLAPLVYMGFPFLFAISAAIILFSLLLRSKFTLYGIIAMALCYPQAKSLAPLHFSRTTTDTSVSTDTFGVMSFNTYYFNSFRGTELDSLAAAETTMAILEADPDIVALQEAMPFDPFTFGSKKIPPALSAQIRNLYPYRHFSHEAMGIISKYPFKIINIPHYNPQGEQSFLIQRADISVGDSIVTLFNVHLQSLHFSPAELAAISAAAKGSGTQTLLRDGRHGMLWKISLAFRKRALQAETLRSIIDTVPQNRATVVCGDFNDVPGCWAMRKICGTNLSDAYADSGLFPAITYRKHHLYFRIDQMLYSHNLVPLGAKVVKSGGSDHFPIFTLFSLQTEKQ